MKSASLGLLAAALATSLPATAESAIPLTWTSCDSVPAAAANITARMECSRLAVPRDYANPAAGTLNLAVVRVRAAAERGARHDGTLLLEQDEFSGPLDQSVAAMASGWLEGDENWRNVANRLDLVGLAPRLMDDASGHDCLSATSRLPRHASLGADTTHANFAIAENLARAVGTACQNDPMHSHIGMSPRVEDIDMLRNALGQSRLHILGTGYGGWVATYYAERHPQNVGRLLLDSTWDADGSISEAMEARVAERGRTIRQAVSALVDAPDRYGWGSDASDIHRRLGMLPASAYAVWMRNVDDGHELSAALTMGRLLERDATLSTDVLRGTLATTRFAIDAKDDGAIRAAAERLLDRLDAEANGDPYGFGPRANGIPPEVVASAFAARCNDGSWGTRRRYWRDRTLELGEAWPAGVGNETFQGMVCSEWQSAFEKITAAPTLYGVPRFLMVHAEFDAEAPLRNAAMMLNAHSSANMVVARGLRAHGVITRTDRPCVSAVAGQFLADGVLPANKLTNCRLPVASPAP
ncbi:pimeloyl-ACP methyl ester carboxylesterase [Luteibacter jiangsuensis]|uniref:Pimeloyl-ACP methyl ester carboxylesterase n=1 Tax=Luteibacter jiangsuensis TaxID=637577 RepID=A0ABT9SVZ7_9GAMM|nr:alpha/beta fold hydrolase [Luteibacter jiangsuensis]MDQ0009176.1 pimeloyl-ACP methyl ester carboxylesterase [Luteibacter jiangsuensis]